MSRQEASFPVIKEIHLEVVERNVNLRKIKRHFSNMEAARSKGCSLTPKKGRPHTIARDFELNWERDTEESLIFW